MMKIDFIVAGAAKSGTTSLFHYLNSHPRIFIPSVKECRFFSKLDKNFKGLGAEYYSNEGITDDDDYRELFVGNEDKICGDISNDYLYYSTRSIENIKKYVGTQVKIIIILRNPVERAFSSYMHHIREGWEVLSFREALEHEDQRFADNWGWTYHFKRAGLYSQSVKAYIDNFNNIKIYTYEDLKHLDWLMSDVFSFLNVDQNIIDLHSKEKFNKSGRPRFRFINDLSNGRGRVANVIKPVVKKLMPTPLISKIKRKIKNVNLVHESISYEDRNYLMDFYKDDICELEKIIDRDLSGWLEK
ncbi:sulfotransferase [Vibrio mangrovi]|uniref:Sulfotransferase domain protein n=1 Tax=Vibrio mangrovi TaxID=474394 RepID=A0A1Y6IYD7_9VIBR|nr:sulfotransferase domain-containing protein [Vibrio mangrovi]MDW6002167.1 sulfotransferase domain-containing protein [Vibrio mangrovi]SMS01512.1 Sulfotransferase domain protein [Vibrio mangrovi]